MPLAERNPEDVARIAEELGVKVVGSQPQADGSQAMSLDCPTVMSKVNLLVMLGRYDGEHFADIHKLARSIIGPAGDDDGARLEAIQRFVQRHIGFCFEAGEVYPSALLVLAQGIGDCDDHAIVTIALAHAVGYDTTAEAFFWNDDEGHVAPLVKLDGDWLWIETTIGARLGEHPIDAAKRLNVDNRGDIRG